MTTSEFPGELLSAAGDIELNAGRPTLRVTVANSGDRPIQVGSHFHFFETNEALAFDRPAARGFRLAESRQQQKGPGQPLLARIEQLIDQVLFDADVSRQHVGQKTFGKRGPLVQLSRHLLFLDHGDL